VGHWLPAMLTVLHWIKHFDSCVGEWTNKVRFMYIIKEFNKEELRRYMYVYNWGFNKEELRRYMYVYNWAFNKEDLRRYMYVYNWETQ